MLEKNRIIFVCCADDAVRDNYVAEHYSDEIMVPFTSSDYHLCSNILIMNSDYKKMLKDVLRTSSTIVVSTPVIDLNVLDGLFIRRVLKGGYSYCATVVFCDLPDGEAAAYRPQKSAHGFSDIRYVLSGQHPQSSPYDPSAMDAAEELVGKYNDDGLVRLVNECMFLAPRETSAGGLAYAVARYLLAYHSYTVDEIAFVQNVAYALRSSKGRDSETSVARAKEWMGVRGYITYALLKIIHSQI